MNDKEHSLRRFRSSIWWGLAGAAVLAGCGGGQSDNLASRASAASIAAPVSHGPSSSAESLIPQTISGASSSWVTPAASARAGARSLPGGNMVVATSTAAATGGGGAVTRYMVDVQSTTAVESVSLHQGSDPNTTVVTTGTRKANGSYEVTVPSAGATDALSTFVRIRYVDGNSVETSLAAVAR